MTTLTQQRIEGMIGMTSALNAMYYDVVSVRIRVRVRVRAWSS